MPVFSVGNAAQLPHLAVAPRETVKMPNGADEDALAGDMIQVHGSEAADVARANARTAALAGAVVSAKSWIKVVGAIQRRVADRESGPDEASSAG